MQRLVISENYCILVIKSLNETETHRKNIYLLNGDVGQGFPRKLIPWPLQTSFGSRSTSKWKQIMFTMSGRTVSLINQMQGVNASICEDKVQWRNRELCPLGGRRKNRKPISGKFMPRVLTICFSKHSRMHCLSLSLWIP